MSTESVTSDHSQQTTQNQQKQSNKSQNKQLFSKQFEQFTFGDYENDFDSDNQVVTNSYTVHSGVYEGTPEPKIAPPQMPGPNSHW